MDKEIKTQALDKVLTMTNTDSTNFISERNGKIYRTPFKEEYKVSDIEIDDVILFHDVVSGGQGTNKILGIEYGELISPIIDPDNNPIYTERLDLSATESIIPLEKGEIDINDGSLLEWNPIKPYIRSNIFIPITLGEEYKFSCPSGAVVRLRVILFDSAKRIIHDKWNNGISNYKEMNLLDSFSTDLAAAKYMMVDIKGNGNPTTGVYIDKILPPVKHYLTVNKIRMVDEYNISIDDTLEGTSKQIDINHDIPYGKVSTYVLRAPSNNPLDTKVRLLNAGIKTSQLVDIRSVRDNENLETIGRCEIGIRSFEKDTPIPEFVVGFADSINGELIHKFTVDPDAMPVRLTKEGVQFRINNASNNKAGKNELLTIDFWDLSKKINKMYTSLLSRNLLIDQELPENVELVNINAVNIDYDSDEFPTVADALDFLIINNNYIDMTLLQEDMKNLKSDMKSLSTTVSILDKSVDMKVSELNGIVNTYKDSIDKAVDNSNRAVANVESIVNTVNATANKVNQNIKDIKKLQDDLILQEYTCSTNNKKVEEAIADLRNNKQYPINRMISGYNSGIIYIYPYPDYTDIVGIPYIITAETAGMLYSTFTVVSNMTNNALTMVVKIDGDIVYSEFKHTLNNGYNIISISFPIPSTIGFNTGEHVLQIAAKCDDQIIVESGCSTLHLFQEIAS